VATILGTNDQLIFVKLRKNIIPVKKASNLRFMLSPEPKKKKKENMAVERAPMVRLAIGRLLLIFCIIIDHKMVLDVECKMAWYFSKLLTFGFVSVT
jgi:hypothetical protein